VLVAVVPAILGPFPDIAVAIEQAPGIGTLFSHRLGSVLRVLAEPGIGIEVLFPVPERQGVWLPARAAYSHSASVGNR